ncbi:NIPA-like protein 2 isoform X6 [Hippopotamus amphibius kiboko]|uniref:NIPA-like protein 2 isoform X6 n=1 Tax=Hippopotamus amphibius kiboko TaxID=575201 RepID=UPI00259235BA|nr:NIPA-like protein 2 isoform X6 [Hippopotamus amphibius kiboko]
MAAPAPGGPGAAASAALDELSRNFTYWALGAGNGSLSGAWYRRNQIHLFGVLLAILGNLVISISLNIQKYSHLQLAHQERPRPYFKSVLWWGGAILMAVGETGNFAAYGFAPITLIAPLGCISVTGSAIISVLFLKENLRASDLLGMTLAFAGTYLLVNFAPNIAQAISARTIQYYFVGWQFMMYVKRNKTHCDSANPGGTSRLLNQATKLYSTATVVPVNHIFFTTSAIIAGIVFYQEFLGADFLTIFIYVFGCFLSFLGVVLVTRNREKEHLPQSYIDFGNVPGKQTLDKIQPDSNGLSYGTLPDGSDSTKSPSGEKKEV